MNKNQMGFDGIWFGVLLRDLKARYKGMPEANSLNNTVISTMYREYQASQQRGYTPATYVTLSPDKTVGKWNGQTYAMARNISNRTGISNLVLLNFFHVLWDNALRGKVPYKAWNPKGFQESKKQKEKINPNILSTAKSMATTGLKKVTLLVLSGLAIGTMYLLHEKK